MKRSSPDDAFEVDDVDSKRMREMEGHKRKSEIPEAEVSKRQRWTELIPSVIHRLPSGWNLFLSKFIEPSSESAVVLYRPPEETLLGRTPHDDNHKPYKPY